MSDKEFIDKVMVEFKSKYPKSDETIEQIAHISAMAYLACEKVKNSEQL